MVRCIRPYQRSVSIGAELSPTAQWEQTREVPPGRKNRLDQKRNREVIVPGFGIDLIVPARRVVTGNENPGERKAVLVSSLVLDHLPEHEQCEESNAATDDPKDGFPLFHFFVPPPTEKQAFGRPPSRAISPIHLLNKKNRPETVGFKVGLSHNLSADNGSTFWEIFRLETYINSVRANVKRPSCARESFRDPGPRGRRRYALRKSC